MNSDYIREPKNGLVKFGPEVVAEIRKQCRMDKKQDREEAIRIIQEWIKQQNHFVKKDFTKDYIERFLTCCNKGSVERVKKQLDKICTMRTLMPKFFHVTNLKKSDIPKIFDKVSFAVMPTLTPEYYRLLFIKAKPNAITTSYDYTLLYKLLVILAEYFSAHEYCRGFIVVGDYLDVNIIDFLFKINLVEFQQFVPIITKGYGCKIKGIYLLTTSKMIERFISMIKPMFSDKIGRRIQAVNKRSAIRDIVNSDWVPVAYGGKENSVEAFHVDFVEILSSEQHEKRMAEMNKAVTDETKRQTDKFNEQYMGMPGTFRTLSLD